VDGSRAYVTGKFKDDLTDDVDGLSESQIADLFNWQDFYEKNYKYIGKVNGRFYDADGVATPYLHRCEELLASHKQVRHYLLHFIIIPIAYNCRNIWNRI
jgi:hypothetical protein